ncbi:glutamate decarboxylase [Cryomorpha ignava]|uniref:Glutamate decarboxylase n=1 Tax=Cryomorpha ignava TaxID=101383 RepID=A0A7K3WKL4_9FLAO|nr:pyridoxal-dependent decarboxylase [Cryomorpha ignava]NEN22187.1 glutamate decarboxylase [Cryomorpha ignava]
MKNNTTDKAVLAKVFDLMNDWILESQNPDTPVIDYHKPEELQKILKLNISPEGANIDEILVEIQKYLKYAVKTGHPAYLNQLFGGFNFPAFLGELVTALTNTSMYTYEVAPVATLMEKALMEKMIGYTGWKSGTGSLLTGGSNTNMVAMLLARNVKFDGSKMNGIPSGVRPAVLVSERSHFSMLKGANTIGIGQNAVIKVPVDENGRMRGTAVQNAFNKAVADGYTPFILCTTAGTTETGSFDAINEVSDFAQTNNLWHHVDGSWGGSSIISKKYQHLFLGLEKADSFSWNPHKLMNIPLICSALLVKGNNVMREEIQSYDSDYIYHSNDNSDYDLGPASLQCGRRVDSLKLWLAWKFYGDEGYAKRIEHLYDLAGYCTTYVENHDDLELLFPTQSLNVNFRFRTPEGIDVDAFNEALRYKLIETGDAMVNYCILPKGLSIRLVLLNPDLTQEDLDRFYNRFLNAAYLLLKQWQKPVVKVNSL